MRTTLDLLYNFHWVVPGELARSAQSYAGFLPSLLKRHGIRSVLNLRGAKPGWRWWEYETRVCGKLGVAHGSVRFNSGRIPTRALLLETLDAFDTMPRPILVKCSGGQDRTSFAAALYLLHTRGAAAGEDAKAQLARWPYLHLPKQHQRWLKAFFDFVDECDAAGNLRAWITGGYVPEEFVAWLKDRGLDDGFRGLTGVPSASASRGDAS